MNEKINVNPQVDEIKAIYERMGLVKDPHHERIQYEERKADWAWSMFMLDFLLFEGHTEHAKRDGKALHFNLTAKKRGPTTKGVES